MCVLGLVWKTFRCLHSSLRCFRGVQSPAHCYWTPPVFEMGRSRSRSSSRTKHSKSSKHSKKRSRSRSRDKDRKRRSKSRESKRNRKRDSRSRSRSNTATTRRERDRPVSPPERIDIFGRALSKRSAVDEKQKKEEEEKKAEMERQRRMWVPALSTSRRVTDVNITWTVWATWGPLLKHYHRILGSMSKCHVTACISV